MWAIVATWTMAKEGIDKVQFDLKSMGKAQDAVENAIRCVEDNPYYKSVGFGGLPNELMEVELDAAFMDGTTFDIGAVAALKDISNPISVARLLSGRVVNNVLVGEGAQAFAIEQGFERKEMLSDRAKAHYRNRVKEMEQKEISPYSGHDTVGMVSMDVYGNVVAGTSTSGLFMKKKGRVGDSPIIGSGLYADSAVGGASATGLGEDLMKGVVSYEVVRLMKDGLNPQVACEKVVFELDALLTDKRGKSGDISIVAINTKGEWGAASNIDSFSFSVATQEQENTVYTTKRVGDRMVHSKASQDWIDRYMDERKRPIEDLK